MIGDRWRLLIERCTVNEIGRRWRHIERRHGLLGLGCVIHGPGILVGRVNCRARRREVTVTVLIVAARVEKERERVRIIKNQS